MGTTRAARVALLYNLVLKPGTRLPSPPDASRSLKKLASIVERWGLALRPTFKPYDWARSRELHEQQTKACPEVMFYKLEHKV